MAKRNIVKIDEVKCNGCGLCVTACAEGAIRIIEGKARLISETYCDGLGACLGHCPQDAITIEERECARFDEAAVQQHLAAEENKQTAPACPSQGFVCPGMRSMDLKADPQDKQAGDVSSQLQQWPVQLHLVNPAAPYFQGADLMLVADCVPFAMGNFHSDLLKDKRIAVGCPKLDDRSFYVQKMADILKISRPASLTVAHMSVPCCSGMTMIAKEAIRQSGLSMPFADITIDLQGQIINRETITP